MAQPAWTLTPHVCRVCFGRILRSVPTGQGIHEPEFVCSNCGVHAHGDSPAVVCACGARYKTGRSMGLVCAPNDSPTPEFPSLFIATQAESQP